MSESTPDTFPMPRTCPFSPPPQYARMRAESGVVRASLPTGAPVWAVTRYAEARQVLADPRISSHTGRPERPRGPEDDRTDEGFFIDTDPPVHTRYRRMVIPELSVRSVAALRPRIRAIVAGALDGVLAAGPPADLVASFTRPVSVRVVCELLGVPPGDRGFVESRMAALTVMRMDPGAADASRELRGLLRALAVDDARPGGLIDRLVRRYGTTGELSVDALVNICFLLLLGGYESPGNMIGLGVLTLLEHPEQLAALRADPGLLPGAVEELLRFHSVQDWVTFDRRATADLAVGGVRVRAGDRLAVLVASANRDAAAFERPDEVDLRRSGNHHLAFGHGPHQCVAQHLARAELTEAYAAVLARLPGLRLAVPLDEVPFAQYAAFFGPHALPVAWD